jgi:hypothetical protein
MQVSTALIAPGLELIYEERRARSLFLNKNSYVILNKQVVK